MANIYKALKKDVKDFNESKIPIYHIRALPVRPNEVLYDKEGLAVAIKTKGKILAILEGVE
tara:strand:- start:188 stop:370 length:183 start_codon:yes stop_codon:yes gene_type:complete